jgi:transcription elongation factor Elf1
MNQIEQFFFCPHCGEHISMLLDLSVSEQIYIEDCEVCCAPIEINYSACEGELINFSVNP